MTKELLTRILDWGWKNFRRNSYVSVGTTGVMTLVLLLFLSLVGLNFLATTVVSSLEEKVDISVYFKAEAGDEEIAQVRQQLQDVPAVKFVQYVSRDQALADFKQRHAGDALIQESLAELDTNPLQASLNIKAKSSGQYAAITAFLEANKFRPLIDKINFYENEQVIARIEQISHGIGNWGFLATLIIAVIAMLVTFNTIRLTIYSQKQEIEIMRLVGGSNWYIRGPYMVEGALYGLLAGIIALALFYPIASFASPKVALLMPGVSLIGYFTGNFLKLALLTFGTGILLGVISSLIAIRKFLKV